MRDAVWQLLRPRVTHGSAVHSLARLAAAAAETSDWGRGCATFRGVGCWCSGDLWRSDRSLGGSGGVPRWLGMMHIHPYSQAEHGLGMAADELSCRS